jgi:hypothetical protein
MPIQDNNVCPFHEARGNEMHEIRSAVDKHTGQWKLLLAMIGFFVTASLSFGGLMYKTQEEVQQSVASIDKTVSAYISMHTVEKEVLEGRVDKLEN